MSSAERYVIYKHPQFTVFHNVDGALYQFVSTASNVYLAHVSALHIYLKYGSS